MLRSPWDLAVGLNSPEFCCLGAPFTVSHIQVSHILTTQRFTHLQQLSLPVRDPELAQQLQDWRHTYGIGEVAPEA